MVPDIWNEMVDYIFKESSRQLYQRDHKSNQNNMN